MVTVIITTFVTLVLLIVKCAYSKMYSEVSLS